LNKIEKNKLQIFKTLLEAIFSFGTDQTKKFVTEQMINTLGFHLDKKALNVWGYLTENLDLTIERSKEDPNPIKFKVSKSILTIFSNFIRASLQKTTSKKNIFTITDPNPKLVKKVITFLHTNKLRISENSFINLARISVDFDIEKLKPRLKMWYHERFSPVIQQSILDIVQNAQKDKKKSWTELFTLLEKPDKNNFNY
jgi:hypothetical protein